MKILKELLKQPYWILALGLGAVLVALPCVTFTKDWHWTTHPPTTYWLVCPGAGLLLLSAAAFVFVLVSKRATDEMDIGAGLNLSRVKEANGRVWTSVNRCEVGVVSGRIEEYAREAGTAVALPCNEYFDNCAEHPTSALGAFTKRVFEGQIDAFQSLVEKECQTKMSQAIKREKVSGTFGTSFGPGRCVLFVKPLDRSVSVALVSTTTQRAGKGLCSRISYLFEGIRELAANMADARINEVVMPIFGGGHGGLSPQLALVGTLLAVAEVARYGERGHRLKKVTIVVFKRDSNTPAEVNEVVIRRALALISSLD
jgi:hypothetical protein